jgi:DNA polymerase epsilon subunit 2
VALPRRPIPEQYTKSLRQRVRHITFASNPCRVRYFTQEIVLFREDLLKKMQRHLAVPLVLDDPSVPDITEQLVESLLDQVGNDTRRLLPFRSPYSHSCR